MWKFFAHGEDLLSQTKHTLSLRLETRAAELPTQKTENAGESLLRLLLRAKAGVTACIIDMQWDRFAAIGSCS